MKMKMQYEAEDTSRAARQASPEAVERFKNSPCGMSAHWGLYSLFSRNNEWIYFNERMQFEPYKKMMERFNPKRFCAEEWADLLLEAGFQFLLITSKHHDGFCLWDTALTDFKITSAPFARDPLQELARALRERNLALHFYYSLVDWTHPAYRRDWNAYVAYYQGQIRELCTNFGEVGGIVFDGYWPRAEFDGDEIEYFAPRGPWDLAGMYDLIHEIQPNAMVTNNTHIPPLKGEDYQVWELDLPGENTIGFNCTEIGDKPTASWWNINAGWAYQPRNHAVKSVEEIYKIYQAVRGENAVFFLNVGPRPFGDIHPEEQMVLRQLGKAIRMGGAL